MVTVTVTSDGCCYVTPEQYREDDPQGIDQQIIPAGTQVEYLGHIPGGNIKVRYQGQIVIINPNATSLEARSKP